MQEKNKNQDEKKVIYGGIVKNSIFESSCLPGEIINYKDTLGLEDFEAQSMLEDEFELPISIKDLYAGLKQKGRYEDVYKKIELRDAANYLIHLYDKLDDKYDATIVKIQCLLYIANLKYYFKYNTGFLPDNIEFVPINGIRIPNVYGKVRDMISIGKKVNEFNHLMLESHNLLKYKVSKIHGFDENILSKECKKILLETFIAFGSYENTELGIMINELNSSFINKPFFKYKTSFYEKDYSQILNCISNVNNEVTSFIRDDNIVVDEDFQDMARVFNSEKKDVRTSFLPLTDGIQERDEIQEGKVKMFIRKIGQKFKK